MDPEVVRTLLRWRLVLGGEAERAEPMLGLSGLLADPAIDQESIAELTAQEIEELDETLDFVYGT